MDTSRRPLRAVRRTGLSDAGRRQIRGTRQPKPGSRTGATPRRYIATIVCTTRRGRRASELTGLAHVRSALACETTLIAGTQRPRGPLGSVRWWIPTETRLSGPEACCCGPSERRSSPRRFGGLSSSRVGVIYCCSSRHVALQSTELFSARSGGGSLCRRDKLELVSTRIGTGDSSAPEATNSSIASAHRMAGRVSEDRVTSQGTGATAARTPGEQP
jgi:hypothetical protein